MAGESAQSEATVTVRRRRRTLLDYFGVEDESETKRRRLRSNSDYVDDSVPQVYAEEEKKEDEPKEDSVVELPESHIEKTDVASAEEEGLRTAVKKYMESISLAKIRIQCNVGEAVLIGSFEDIKRVEELMNRVITEAYPGSSHLLIAQAFSTAQASSGEQHGIQFSLAKDGAPRKIGKTEYTIEGMQASSPYAEIQIGSDADNVQLHGTKADIKWAEELIKAVEAEADAKGTPSFVHRLFPTTHDTASGDEKHGIIVSVDLLGALVDDLHDTLQVDKYYYLGIDENGDYFVADKPQNLPSGYIGGQFKMKPEGLRQFLVIKSGKATYDVVMVGILNVVNCAPWIAGVTIYEEEGGDTCLPPFFLPPLALSYPFGVTPSKYMQENWDEYKKMLSERLKHALKKSGYNPADYDFNEDLCLSVTGQLKGRDIHPHQCKECGLGYVSHGICSLCCHLPKKSDAVPQTHAEEEKKEAESKEESEVELPESHNEKIDVGSSEITVALHELGSSSSPPSKGDSSASELPFNEGDFYLGIDENDDYFVSMSPKKLPSGYTGRELDDKLEGLRCFRVDKSGKDTYDIVMVGILNVVNDAAWIAAIYDEEGGHNSRPDVDLPPLALSYPLNVNATQYKKENPEKYRKMLSERLERALKKSGYNPADYDFNEDLW